MIIDVKAKFVMTVFKQEVLVEHGGVDRSTGYANAKVFLFLLMVVIYMEVGLPFIDKGNTT